MKTAIISAAGWKGCGRNQGLAGCPECFLPLGDGTTCLSRLSGQLRHLGFDVFIGIGKLGYPFGEYLWRYQEIPDNEEAQSVGVLIERLGLIPDESPWTQARLDYANTLGTTVQISDPGHGNSHDTICTVMDGLKYDRWRDLVAIQGDAVLPTELIKRAVELPYPCQYQMHPNHTIFHFNMAAGIFYREYCEHPYMRKHVPLLRDWKRISGWLPNGHPHGADLLRREGGIANYGPHNVSGMGVQFIDIDFPSTYCIVQAMVADGSIDILCDSPPQNWRGKYGFE